ncbi:MAG: hypothetical protein P1V97_23645 [Planctomycetota bacterium]|nr:hypothetical protein [Planctomycetota bacterium]
MAELRDPEGEEELPEEIERLCHLATPVPSSDMGPEPLALDAKYMLLGPPVTLLIIFGAVWITMHHVEVFFAVVVTILLGIPFLWTLASSLRPAMPERCCPGCEAERLVLLDPQEDCGVRCLDCDFRDVDLRIAYMKDLMNDPEIATEAGYVLDDYGQAHLPKSTPQ